MEWVRKWGVTLLLGVLGLGLVVYGVWDQVKPREVRVEIIKVKGESEKVKVGGEIVVDVAGSVEKPGVYKLPSNSRIGDALVVAGGLSASADRAWITVNLNLAQKLEDGEKVYIPGKSENSDNRTTQNIGVSETQKNQKININTASVSELDRLEGIGPSRAQAIVDNRPYSKTEELVSKARIPQSVYDKISSSISVY
ncbi:helix-hairpin-helix domain-containing protein [Candidatus Woesebacteria bacterium]|nr:helix-hairpin-helix domain-containing protein [Candidatus Woesebacteria bacterium]